MRFGYASVSPDTGQSASFDVTKVFSLAVKSLNALFPTSDCVRTGEGERRRKKNIFWGGNLLGLTCSRAEKLSPPGYAFHA